MQGARPLHGQSQMMARLAHGLVPRALQGPGAATGHAAQYGKGDSDKVVADEGADGAKSGSQAEDHQAKGAQSA